MFSVFNNIFRLYRTPPLYLSQGHTPVTKMVHYKEVNKYNYKKVGDFSESLFILSQKPQRDFVSSFLMD